MAHPNYYKLQKFFEESLVNLGCKEAWTGMALGGDTVFAKAVLSLQEQGYRIRLYAAIPCDNQSCKWPKASQEEYDRILSKRTDYTVVSPGAVRCMENAETKRVHCGSYRSAHCSIFWSSRRNT